MRVEVIGGGPAGLRASKLLSEKGHDVVLYEANKIGNQIRCGEAYLDVYPVERPKYGLLFKQDKVYHTINGEEITMDGSHIYQYDKREMLKGMKNEAEDAGVEVVEKETVDSADNETLTVDASGFPSLVYSQKDYKVGFAVSHIVDEEVDYMKFIWEKSGYYWKFPKQGKSNVGYGSFGKSDDVWKRSKDYAKSIGNVIDSGGGNIPIDFPRNLWLPKKRTILVGDAAGLANSFHGGGIHTALLSAEVVTEFITKGNLQKYETKLNRLMEAEKRSTEMANKFLNMGCLDDLLRTDGTIRDFTNPSFFKKVRIGMKYLKNKLIR